MSLTFVCAPVEVGEEMAAALPVSLQPPLSYKIPQQMDFKGVFVAFKAANKWAALKQTGWPIRWCLGPAPQGIDRRRSVGLMTVEASRQNVVPKDTKGEKRFLRRAHAANPNDAATGGADLRIFFPRSAC